MGTYHPLLQCDSPYHLGCLSPPLSEVPKGEWFCPECGSDGSAAYIALHGKKGKVAASGKSKKENEEEADEDDNDEGSQDGNIKKRKVSNAGENKAAGMSASSYCYFGKINSLFSFSR
jgi:hypothetical protein